MNDVDCDWIVARDDLMIVSDGLLLYCCCMHAGLSINKTKEYRFLLALNGEPI